MDQTKTGADIGTETLQQIWAVIIESTMPPASMSAEVLRFGRGLAGDPVFDRRAQTLSDQAPGAANRVAILPYRAKMCLAEYDCGLSSPPRHTSFENTKPGNRLAFHYRTRAQPTLVSALV